LRHPKKERLLRPHREGVGSKMTNERYRKHLEKAEHEFRPYTSRSVLHRWRTHTALDRSSGLELECRCSPAKRLWFLFTEQ
jgi:hypothetical protein